LYDLNEEESAVKEWEELSRINPSYELSEGEHLDELILHYKLKQEDKKRSADPQPGKEGITVGKSQSPL
jgi:F0F1-type ATP synthase delta subunit